MCIHFVLLASIGVCNPAGTEVADPQMVCDRFISLDNRSGHSLNQALAFWVWIYINSKS